MAAATDFKPDTVLAPGGASFLLSPVGSTPVFVPERFTDEQLKLVDQRAGKVLVRAWYPLAFPTEEFADLGAVERTAS